jgi:hypothetical protein
MLVVWKRLVGRNKKEGVGNILEDITPNPFL